MTRINNKYIVISAIILITIAVVTVSLMQKNESQPVTQNQEDTTDHIPEMTKIVPADTVIAKIAGNRVELTVGSLKTTGIVTEKTLILKQGVSKGVIGLVPAKLSDLSQGDRVLVTPKPEKEGEFNITQIQVIK